MGDESNDGTRQPNKVTSQGLKTKSIGRTVAYGAVASVVSEVCTIPIDVVKVRLQIQGSRAAVTQTMYKGMLDAFITIPRNEGIGALFKGIKPACLRQATYGSMRLSLYEPIKNVLHKENGHETVPLYVKVLAGTSSGALAAAVCSPTDLIKIRMQGNVTLRGSDASTLRYKGVMDAFASIVREEGWKGLYQGVSPTVQRAAVLAAVELSSYDEAKYQIVSRGWISEGFPSHFAASLVAGFFAAIASSPADVIKSRLMNQGSGDNRRYSSTIDCAIKSVKEEGFFSLWKGLLPNYMRLAPNVTILFVVFEAMKNMFE